MKTECAYNTRHEWPSLFECSACGWSCDDTTPGDTSTYNFSPNCGKKITQSAKVIAIDFDGCLVKNAYPDIGEINQDVFDDAIRERKNGANLILWTCREGNLLDAAVDFCKAHGIEFDAVNDNLPERIAEWGTNPRKIGADEYWDDRAVQKCGRR